MSTSGYTLFPFFTYIIETRNEWESEISVFLIEILFLSIASHCNLDYILGYMKFGDRIVLYNLPNSPILENSDTSSLKKYNRWFKLRICTTAHLFNIRNTPYTHFTQLSFIFWKTLYTIWYVPFIIFIFTSFTMIYFSHSFTSTFYYAHITFLSSP